MLREWLHWKLHHAACFDCSRIAGNGRNAFSEAQIMTVWKWLEQGEYRGYCEKWGAKSAPFLESSNEQDLGLFNLCIEASW